MGGRKPRDEAPVAKPTAMGIYQTLREDLSPDALARLQAEVRGHYEQLVKAQERDELVATDLAELLCVRLEALLAVAHQLDAERRGDIVGAARYFVSDDDAIPDAHACTGLDDDVEVFNHVVRVLGRPDLLIAG